jgi:hypothetical protein
VPRHEQWLVQLRREGDEEDLSYHSIDYGAESTTLEIQIAGVSGWRAE